MICIQKRGNLWWVWMDSASNEEKYPDYSDVSYEAEKLARAYAMGWLYGETVVEYGIVVLPQVDIEDKKKALVDELILEADNIKIFGLTEMRIRVARKLLLELEKYIAYPGRVGMGEQST